MKIEQTKIPGAYIIRLEPRCDERGSFSRVFCKRELQAAGLNSDIAQMNLSENDLRGTLRGLHLQRGEWAEDKLVTCVCGSIFDVCVDVREGSGTFGQWIGETLTEGNGAALYIPKGCAHGYLTLTNETRVLYAVTQFYAPGAETGYRYNDPTFGVEWPLPLPYIISEKDKNWALMSERGVKDV